MTPKKSKNKIQRTAQGFADAYSHGHVALEKEGEKSIFGFRGRPVVLYSEMAPGPLRARESLIPVLCSEAFSPSTYFQLSGLRSTAGKREVDEKER